MKVMQNHAADGEQNTKQRQLGSSKGPVLEKAVLGLKNYWYPIMFSRDLGKKPTAIKLCGEPIMLIREKGKAYALRDECPHRGIPLRLGKREFPGTWTCRYHGWTYEVASGRCVAALTDGPDSPIAQKVNVRTYPTHEFRGVIWVWPGDMEPVALEEDVPEEWSEDNIHVKGWFRLQYGNWRAATENGFDEGHAKYLHRDSLLTLFQQGPSWSVIRVVPDGRWLKRVQDRATVYDDFPGLGKWPKFRFWRRSRSAPFKAEKTRGQVSAPTSRGLEECCIALPSVFRVVNFPLSGVSYYEWYVPSDETHYIFVQFVVLWTPSRLKALWFDLQYRIWYKWLSLWLFSRQDNAMVAAMTNHKGPERLYRPDVSITAWRKMIERRARGEVEEPAELEEETAVDPAFTQSIPDLVDSSNP